MGQEHLLGLQKLKFIINKDMPFWILLMSPHHELLVNGSLDTCSTALPQNSLGLLACFSPDLQQFYIAINMHQRHYDYSGHWYLPLLFAPNCYENLCCMSSH